MVLPSIVPTGPEQLGLTSKEARQEPIDFIFSPYHLGLPRIQCQGAFDKFSPTPRLAPHPRIKEDLEITGEIHPPDQSEQGKVILLSAKPTDSGLCFVGPIVPGIAPSQGGGNDEAIGAKPKDQGPERNDQGKRPPDQEVLGPKAPFLPLPEVPNKTVTNTWSTPSIGPIAPPFLGQSHNLSESLAPFRTIPPGTLVAPALGQFHTLSESITSSIAPFLGQSHNVSESIDPFIAPPTAFSTKPDPIPKNSTGTEDKPPDRTKTED